MIAPRIPSSPLRNQEHSPTIMRTPSAILLAALLALPAAAQKVNDSLVKSDGSRLRGVEVTALTLKGAAFAKGKETQELPYHMLAEVEWSSPPDAFVSAMSAMDRGEYANAAQLFGEAVGKTERAVLKAEARFLQCKAAVSAAGGDASSASAAADALAALLAEVPDHWRTPEALLLLGRARRVAGKGTDAEQSLKDLDDRSVREGWGQVWSARAKLELALTLLDQNRADEARNAFQAAGSTADSALGSPGPDENELKAIRTNARVGEGETYVSAKDFPRAIEFFRSLASGNASPDLVAAAKAGEGQALFLQAGDANPAQLRQAQMALAQASLLDAGSGETAAKANFYLGLCLLGLGMEKEGDTFKARARNYFQIVVKSYPSTRWASLARAELAK